MEEMGRCGGRECGPDRLEGAVAAGKEAFGASIVLCLQPVTPNDTFAFYLLPVTFYSMFSPYLR